MIISLLKIIVFQTLTKFMKLYLILFDLNQIFLFFIFIIKRKIHVCLKVYSRFITRDK